MFIQLFTYWWAADCCHTPFVDLVCTSFYTLFTHAETAVLFSDTSTRGVCEQSRPFLPSWEVYIVSTWWSVHVVLESFLFFTIDEWEKINNRALYSRNFSRCFYIDVDIVFIFHIYIYIYTLRIVVRVFKMSMVLIHVLGSQLLGF